MKAFSLFMVAAVLTFGACESATDSEPLTPADMIQGTWTVTSASIDGSNIPVTVPGFGSIRATFTPTTFSYIYPELDSFGQITADTDTMSGTWSFNDDFSVVTVTPDDAEAQPMAWDILDLGVGRLETRYEALNPNNPQSTSEYLINYALASN